MYSMFEMSSEVKLLAKSPFSSSTSSASSLSCSSHSLSSDLSIDDRKNSQKSRTRGGPIITTTLATAKPTRRKKLKMKKKSASLGSSSSNSSSKITSSSSVSSISSVLNSSDNDLYLYDQTTINKDSFNRNGLLNRYIADSTDDNHILSDIPYQNFDNMCKDDFTSYYIDCTFNFVLEKCILKFTRLDKLEKSLSLQIHSVISQLFHL